MVKINLKKIGVITLIGALALGGLNAGAKKIALNVMSNVGSNEGEAIKKLRDPSTYLTSGNYRGFYDVSFDRKISRYDPLNSKEKYLPDPYNRLDSSLRNLDLNKVYLGMQENPLPISEHIPSRLSNSENITFYSLKDFIPYPEQYLIRRINGVSQEGLQKILSLKKGEALSFQEVSEDMMDWDGMPLGKLRASDFTNVDLGNYTLSFGRDEKGIYTSIYDKWDFLPDNGIFLEIDSGAHRLASTILPFIGKPIHFYDRFYWNDYNSNEKENQK